MSCLAQLLLATGINAIVLATPSQRPWTTPWTRQPTGRRNR